LLLGGFFFRREKPFANITQPEITPPPYATRGAMGEDGKEWIEFPAGSGNRFYREPSTGQWTKAE